MLCLIIMKNIYLDNAASTKTDLKVVKAMLPYFTEKYGNASSKHIMGQEAKRALEESRSNIAKSLKAKAEEIIFTSGGTESNNFALKGIAFANRKKGKHIITSKIEHDCVLNTCKWLEKNGFDVTYIPVDNYGFVNPEDVENALRKNTILVSVMHANNEIGTIEPIAEIGKICKEHEIYFHTDACQSFTKVPLDTKKQNIDLISINAHKIHGPKGVGALFIRRGTKIETCAHGGGHEFGLRSGTENVPGIVGFAKAVKLCRKEHIKYMKKLRDRLIQGVLEIENTELNGPREKRLCNNANFSFKNIEGEAIGAYLDSRGISTSTGSACSSHTLETSHVLTAIGLNPRDANSSLRMSLSRFNTMEEIKYVLDVLPKVVEKLRKISPFSKLRKSVYDVFKKSNATFSKSA